MFENKEQSECTPNTARNGFMQSCVWINVNSAEKHSTQNVNGKNGDAIKFDMEASGFISKST